jgi:hypothetical protein
MFSRGKSPAAPVSDLRPTCRPRDGSWPSAASSASPSASWSVIATPDCEMGVVDRDTRGARLSLLPAAEGEARPLAVRGR